MKPIAIRRLLALLFVIVAITAHAQVSAPRLMRGPQVLQVTPTSAVISWMTDIPATSVVNYGTSLALGSSVSGPTDAPALWNNLLLTGLSPNTTYYYRIISNGTFLTPSSVDFKFTTFPAPTNPAYSNFKFVVMGDTGYGCSTSPVQCELADKINALDPNFMLHVGDISYLQRSLANDGFVESYFGPYQRVIRRIPMFPSPGNHEWYDIWDSLGKPYLDNFALPRNKRYYSFDYGNAHFVSLDSELLVNPDLDPVVGWRQELWLRDDLENATNAVWKFIYFHVPPFSSGDIYHGSNLDVRQIASTVAQRYNVDVVFSGHDHIYERSKPVMVQESNPQQVGFIGNGVTYIVSGGAGQLLYTRDFPDSCSTQGGCSSDIPPAQCLCTAAVRTRNDNFWHVVQADVNNVTLQLRTIKSNLTTAADDTWTITKGLVKGRVTNSSGLPISNATVTIYVGTAPQLKQRAVTQTESNGAFRFYLMAGQSYQMQVTSPCFTPSALLTITIPAAGGTVAQSVVLTSDSSACVVQ